MDLYIHNIRTFQCTDFTCKKHIIHKTTKKRDCGREITELKDKPLPNCSIALMGCLNEHITAVSFTDCLCEISCLFHFQAYFAGCRSPPTVSGALTIPKVRTEETSCTKGFLEKRTQTARSPKSNG